MNRWAVDIYFILRNKAGKHGIGIARGQGWPNVKPACGVCSRMRFWIMHYPGRRLDHEKTKGNRNSQVRYGRLNWVLLGNVLSDQKLIIWFIWFGNRCVFKENALSRAKIYFLQFISLLQSKHEKPLLYHTQKRMASSSLSSVHQRRMLWKLSRS